MNLTTLIEHYIRYRQALGENFYNSACILRAFARSVGSQADAGDVHTDQIATFLTGTGRLTNTWHRKYQVLLGFYRFAKSRGHLTDIPLPATLPKRLPPFVPYIYSRDELRLLLDTAGHLTFHDLSPKRLFLLALPLGHLDLPW